MNWEDKKQVKKGNIGEGIMQRYLEEKGYVLYNPTTPGVHTFDNLAIKDKKNVVIAEAKTKARLTKYECTGIDIRHYEEYEYIRKKHRIPVFIFFIDEWLKEIYGNFLSLLTYERTINNITYPWYPPWGKQILFPMCNMRRNIYTLTTEEAEGIKKYNTRHYAYQEENKHGR